jgi:hypothetical protein
VITEDVAIHQPSEIPEDFKTAVELEITEEFERCKLRYPDDFNWDAIPTAGGLVSSILDSR